MRCRFCDSELPQGALFCGECGRAVSSVPPAATESSHPIVARPLTVAAAPEPGLAVAPGSRGSVEACEQCGATLAATDIFCGECGYIARSVDDRDTRVIDPIAAEGAPAESEGDFLPSPPAPAPTAVSSQPHIETPSDESSDQRSRFVLQFSTGESASVSGTGLIGRNPTPEPGEYFDELVTITDPSRSVSKTHLEFGQEAGDFWIRDRYSGNGTELRAPDAAVVHLIADRRYRVPRGSRVDMGDQFFVVS